MIQATELRLGNLVMYDNRIFKIDCLHKDYPFLNTTEFGYGVVEYRNLQPIPITAKFFKERGYRYDYHHNDITINSDYRVEFSLSKGYLIDGYGLMVEIAYIHELQNLYYALTKTELKL
jgi:hypothetical protein